MPDPLTVTVVAPVEETATDAGGPRVIVVNAVNFVFDPTEITVKAGETVVFQLFNGDDEKHNLVGLGDSGLLSPDFDPGQTIEYEWTAPAEAGTFEAVCVYHPAMIITFTIE